MWWRQKPAPDSTIAEPDSVAGFPRGLPDGDPAKPLASARWASDADILEQFGEWQPGALLLGRAGGSAVGVRDDRHLLTVAGSRAGKGVSLIVPNLLHWPGSCLAIDPKGELATITASRRSDLGSDWSTPMGGRVIALDPFERVSGPAMAFRGSFNPLYRLDPDTDEGYNLASLIADALVIQQEGAGAHWTQSARAFLRGVVLYVAKTQIPAERNLCRVRELLTLSPEESKTFLKNMAEQDGPIGRAANSLLLKPRNEQGSVLSTCDVQTDFLEGQAMRSVLAGHDFDLEDMKRERITAYLCLPAGRLATHGRWLRLMVNLALEAMEQTGPLEEGRHPVLFVLDEFAALGHMENIERAAGQIAGFGVKLWPVIQDLTQLQRDYRASWETFMGNAGVLTFFGNTDLTTLEHISKRLGECELIRTVQSITGNVSEQIGASGPVLREAISGKGVRSGSSGQNRQTSKAASENIMRNPLMTLDEVAFYFARERNNLLAFLPAGRTGVFRRCLYYEDSLFEGLFDPGPGAGDNRKGENDGA